MATAKKVATKTVAKKAAVKKVAAKTVAKKVAVKKAAAAKKPTVAGAPVAALKAFPGLDKDFKKLAARALAELKAESLAPSRGAQMLEQVSELMAYLTQYERWLRYRTPKNKTDVKIFNEATSWLEASSDNLQVAELEDEYKAVQKAGKNPLKAYKVYVAALVEVEAKRLGITAAELIKRRKTAEAARQTDEEARRAAHAEKIRR